MLYVGIPLGSYIITLTNCICRIAGNGVIKVADFGLTEDMYGTNYFRRTKNETGSEEKVPIRWMAPESIENDVYTEATDVVSYKAVVVVMGRDR